MSHANKVSSSPPPTTSSGSRPRTNRSRRPPLPPDTAASGINDLPRREFFSEGSDGEDYDDEEDEEEEDVFAFNRPVTAAQPIGASSSGHGTAPPSGRPTTAGISWAQEAAEEEEPAHVGSSTGPGTLPMVVQHLYETSHSLSTAITKILCLHQLVSSTSVGIYQILHTMSIIPRHSVARITPITPVLRLT